MPKRGVDFLTVGFWNIEKKNQIHPNDNVPYRYEMSTAVQFVVDTVVQWYQTYHVDLIVLAEVTDGSGMGNTFVNYLASRLNVIGHPKPAFQGDFRWSPTRAGTKSVCNFGFLWNERLPVLQGLGERVDWYWEPDHVRPTLILPTGLATIGAIHAKAVIREQAMKEIYEAALHINRSKRPALLIGDMNVPFDSVPWDAKAYMTQAGWGQVPPRVAPTHVTRGFDEFGYFEGKREAVLDYAWRNGGLAQCIAENPHPGYNLWEYIDHAPIMYHLASTAEELPIIIDVASPSAPQSAVRVPRRAPVPA
ncbi:endonuclease/exonuclease/phosphatase family protein [Stappia sp. TSB10GB4]|uniref:endonuclease/exonuclease/phosphatase family protein n=1 Tax=Stappia sp. TSB10GB4 TaxID=2003584 RepID=UPI001644A74C|nr:endonuclease/exonuclease/phosphatase family protein [Stappia sp. TSB10GB4]